MTSKSEYVVDNIEEEINVDTLENWMVDEYISSIKDNENQIKVLENIYNNRADELKRNLEVKKDSLAKRNLYLKSTLGEYAKTQKLKKAKTQSKLPLLSGDIIIKHATKSITKPKEANESKLAELYPEHTTKEEVVKTNWVEIKKNLVMQNHRVYDKETGEDLTDIIEIVEKDEEVIIK